MINQATVSPAAPLRFPGSFCEWRQQLDALGIPAVIAVAGSRGKTTVVRLLDAIFGEAGLRTALWTNRGIEINGRSQRGELVPWSRALGRLRDGSLDLAVQELDWSTVHAVGLPAATYPIVAVTNLCVNSDSCLLQEETLRAAHALRQVRAAVRPDGTLVLNGEDFAVSGDGPHAGVPTALVGLSRDTPLLRNHLRNGGAGVWVEKGQVEIGSLGRASPISSLRELTISVAGAVGFQVHNALMAVAAARACGVPTSAIASALRRFTVPPALVPGSFNVLAVGNGLVVVDRPAPSWFLRPSVRALAHLPGRRLLTVVGRLEAVPDSDLVETGRLLGRAGGALILHSEAAAAERSRLLRHGVAANDVPPVIVHVATERRAISRALRMLRPGDLMYVLADRPTAVLRALDRARDRESKAAGADGRAGATAVVDIGPASGRRRDNAVERGDRRDA